MSGYSGMKAWLIQRFSGIYIAFFAVLMVVVLWRNLPLNYPQWISLFGQPWMQVCVSLFVIALLMHAWIGLRDVILDYIHPIGLKMLIMTAIVIMLLASGFWFFRVLLLIEVIS